MRDPATLVPVFDLDGTLLDSDEALAAAFVALGVDRSAVTRGHVVADECARLGIELTEYLAAYDVTASRPFDGVEDLLAGLGRWGVASNKDPRSGRPELARLGWRPEVALFADAFDGPKRLGPVLEAMGLEARQVVFVGDTGHDRACAEAVGARFVLAGWNPRARPEDGDLVARHPSDVQGLLAADLVT
jgi:HAD superfamily hydrolase (TIGR01549 family)